MPPVSNLPFPLRSTVQLLKVLAFTHRHTPLGAVASDKAR